MNLIVYFMARVFVQLAADIALMMVAKLQIWLEFKGLSAQEQQTPREGGHSDIQIQSKAFPYDEQMLLEDWMDFTMTFVFVSCFSVVLPAISFLALLVSLSEIRLVAYRNLHYVRRPDPETSEGIGIWRDILEWVEILAVIMNLAIAVFVMRPIRDFSWSTKWILFVGAEHVLLTIREVFKSKFPIVPQEVEEANEANHKTLMALLSPAEFKEDAPEHLDSSQVLTSVRSQKLPDIGPDAFPDALDASPRVHDRFVSAVSAANRMSTLAHLRGRNPSPR